MLHCVIEDSLYVVIAKGVEYSFTLTARADKPCFLEHSQLMRDSGLCHAQQTGDIAYTHLALAEYENDPYSCGVTEYLQQLGSFEEYGFVGHYLRDFFHDILMHSVSAADMFFHSLTSCYRILKAKYAAAVSMPMLIRVPRVQVATANLSKT